MLLGPQIPPVQSCDHLQLHPQETWSGLALPTTAGELIATDTAGRIQVVVGDNWILSPFLSSPHWEDKRFCHLPSSFCTPGCLLNAAGAFSLPSLANCFTVFLGHPADIRLLLPRAERRCQPQPSARIVSTCTQECFHGGRNRFCRHPPPMHTRHTERKVQSQPAILKQPSSWGGEERKGPPEVSHLGPIKALLLFANIWS